VICTIWRSVQGRIGMELCQMHATDVARRFGLQRYPRSWRGRCPCCDYPDTFSVRAGRDGQTVLHCASCQDRKRSLTRWRVQLAKQARANAETMLILNQSLAKSG
jgi:hypothetical protein